MIDTESFVQFNTALKQACFHSSSVRLNFNVRSFFFVSFTKNNASSFVSTRITSPTSYLKSVPTKFCSLSMWDYEWPWWKRRKHPWPVSVPEINDQWVQFLSSYEFFSTRFLSAKPTATACFTKNLPDRLFKFWTWCNCRFWTPHPPPTPCPLQSVLCWDWWLWSCCWREWLTCCEWTNCYFLCWEEKKYSLFCLAMLILIISIFIFIFFCSIYWMCFSINSVFSICCTFDKTVRIDSSSWFLRIFYVSLWSLTSFPNFLKFSVDAFSSKLILSPHFLNSVSRAVTFRLWDSFYLLSFSA